MKPTAKGNYRYTVEPYVLLTGVDASVCLLNPIIERYGYQLVVVELPLFEEKFHSLIGLSKPYDPVGQAKLHTGVTVSTQFFETLKQHILFGENFFIKGEMILLKRLQVYHREVVNHGYTIGDGDRVVFEMNDFSKAFIHFLRLATNTKADALLQFHLSEPQREIVLRHGFNTHKGSFICPIELGDAHLSRFSELFRPTFEVNEISHIGYNCFKLSHDIADPETEFVTLMTALESIFSNSTDQISHKVSRHVALLSSGSRLEFQKKYKKMKSLYEIRSKIVHGNRVKGGVIAELPELTTFVREALIFSLSYPKTKQDLFDEFNASGFGRDDLR